MKCHKKKLIKGYVIRGRVQFDDLVNKKKGHAEKLEGQKIVNSGAAECEEIERRRKEEW